MVLRVNFCKIIPPDLANPWHRTKKVKCGAVDSVDKNTIPCGIHKLTILHVVVATKMTKFLRIFLYGQNRA